MKTAASNGGCFFMRVPRAGGRHHWSDHGSTVWLRYISAAPEGIRQPANVL